MDEEFIMLALFGIGTARTLQGEMGLFFVFVAVLWWLQVHHRWPLAPFMRFCRAATV
jgi:hypothetical protein